MLFDELVGRGSRRASPSPETRSGHHASPGRGSLAGLSRRAPCRHKLEEIAERHRRARAAAVLASTRRRLVPPGPPPLAVAGEHRAMPVDSMSFREAVR